tara:strand:- start:14 stop:1396 length:1383 start_codon:yes stop_codon:yes gene_type:complete
MNKRYVGLLAITLLAIVTLTASAHSEEQSITFSGDFNNIIKAGEETTFEITITNSASTENIELSLEKRSGWSSEVSPDKLTVQKSDSKTVSVLLVPPKEIEVGFYSFELHANSDKPLASATLIVGISEDPTPIILEDIQLDTKIYPGQKMPVTLILKNNEFAAENNVKLTISSSALEEPFTVTKSFDGKETKTIAGELAIAPFLDAGKYTLFIRGVGTNSYTIFEKKVTVPKEGSMVVEEKVDYGFLKNMHTVTITNKANYQLEDTYKLDIGSASRFFSHVEPEADDISGSVYEFDISLKSGQTKTIQYTSSYLPLIVGLIILGLLILWFYSKKKCYIRKRILATKGTDGKKTIKVSLIIKNKTYRTLKNLQVTDRVPASLKVVHKASSMKPDIVKKYGAQASLVWKIPKLAPREERIISYYVKAGIKLVGNVSLPSARLSLKNKRKEAYLSNTALLRAA